MSIKDTRLLAVGSSAWFGRPAPDSRGQGLAPNSLWIATGVHGSLYDPAMASGRRDGACMEIHRQCLAPHKIQPEHSVNAGAGG